MIWILSITEQAWYPWVMGGMIGFGAGAWIDYLLRRFGEGRRVADDQERQKIFPEDAIPKQIVQACPSLPPQYQRQRCKIQGEWNVIHIQLETWGVPVPHLEKDAQGNIEILVWYLDEMEPLIRANKMEHARDLGQYKEEQTRP